MFIVYDRLASSVCEKLIDDFSGSGVHKCIFVPAVALCRWEVHHNRKILASLWSLHIQQDAEYYNSIKHTCN